MNEIKIKVKFKKGLCYSQGIKLVQNDYNSTKLVFEFDDEEGTKIFELKDPDDNVILADEIVNNELILARFDEQGKAYPIFTKEGEYIYEVSLYKDNSKLTSASDKFKVNAEQVIIDGEIVETYTPMFDNLLSDLSSALQEADNINIDVEKVGTTSTVTITKKNGQQETVQILDGAKGDTGATGPKGDKGDDGERGPQGNNGADAKINGVNTLTIEAGDNITLDQEGSTLTINSTGGGSGGSSDYEELKNQPKVNNVTLIGNKSLNDLGIQPAGNYALKSEIPDVSNFITNSVNNLLNYYLKSEIYTKQEVNNLIGQIATLQFQVVSTLPQAGDSKYIYLVPSSNPKTQNVKDEYIWDNNSWEQIGSTQIDLTGYATENWVNTQISEFLTQTQIQALINTALSEYTETDPTVPSYVKNITQANITSWNNKQNSISDLSIIRSGASAGATAVQPNDLSTVATSGSYNDLSNKPTIPSAVTETTVTNWGFTKNTGTYSKPSGGIPKTDLASDIQDELDIVNKVTVKTRNYFNLETDIILGKNATGGSVSTRAITVAINTGGGKSTVSVKTLPSNLKYQVWGYNDANFTSPTNYTTSWIETKGTSTVVAKAYVRVLFGTVNNANITMQDFNGLEMQIEAGSTATDFSPPTTAIDYIARNTTYPVHLKICSYNVGMYSNGISTDTPSANATQHMSDFLSENNFDILGVQEGRTNVNGQNIDNTLYKDYFMSQMNTTNLCAIKSQFTLSDTGSGTFTQGSRPYNYGTVRIGNKNVFVINVHLGLTAEQRVSNYTELLAILAQHEYFIAFGDFNAAIDYNTGVDEQTQTEFNNLINAGYTVANGGRWGLLNTMNTTTKHPDNICVSNNIKMISAKVLNIGSTMDSDHLPVVVEIVV